MDLASVQYRVSLPAANRLSSQLTARMATEHNPDLLRSLGNVLGTLPADSIATDPITHAFKIARAPCEIVLRVPAGERLSAVAKEILNSFCSEDSWMSLVSSLRQMTRQPIVRGTKTLEASEPDFDGMGVLKDDDDDGKSKPGEIEEVGPVSLDFNLLSRVLDGIRPQAAPWFSPMSVELLSALLFFIGFTSLVLSYWSGRKAHRSSART
jgi:hypothetical protein